MKKVAPPQSIAFTATLGAIGAALLVTATPPANACNPDQGCGGLSREELARDKAEIKRLNREQARYVQRRDAEYAKGWQAQRDHKDAMADYERRMAEWREAVRRCNAGDYRYCAR